MTEPSPADVERLREAVAHWLWHHLPAKAPNRWYRWLRGHYGTAEIYKRHGPIGPPKETT